MKHFGPLDNDPSKWLTPRRVHDYLKRMDKIPHRNEGESTLIEFVPHNAKTVLDLGTGNGRLIKLIKHKIPNSRFVALDFSSYMINNLRSELNQDSSILIFQHDMNKPLPLKLGRFDLVVSSLAIHHLMDSRKKNLYNEIFTILKPGVVFCNLDHVASDSYKLRLEFRKAMGKRVAYKEHERRLTKVDTQIKWLKHIGFTNVDCYWKWLEFALMIGYKSYRNLSLSGHKYKQSSNL